MAGKGGISGRGISTFSGTISAKMGNAPVGQGIGYGSLEAPQPPPTFVFNLLLENQDNFLLENLDMLLLESSS